MSIYDNLSEIYEKWSSGDAVYKDTKHFYVNALSQMHEGNFLEIGIGTGRISLAVIENTPVSITGVDISEKMLHICQKYYLNMRFRCGALTLCLCDATSLPFCGQFDGAFMPFRTIGHLLTDEALQAMLEGVLRALKPGGWFLFDHYVFNRRWAEDHNDVPILMYQDDKMTIKDLYHYNFARGYLHCQVLVNDQVVESFDFRWLDPDAIRSYAHKIGFEIYTVLGEFDGSPWDEHAFEQIWLLRKPGTDVKDGNIPKLC